MGRMTIFVSTNLAIVRPGLNLAVHLVDLSMISVNGISLQIGLSGFGEAGTHRRIASTMGTKSVSRRLLT